MNITIQMAEIRKLDRETRKLLNYMTERPYIRITHTEEENEL